MQRTLESLPLEGKVAFAKQMTDEVATTRKPSWTCPLISHGSAVPAFSVERLRRLLHSPGNAPLAHSCFGLISQGEAFQKFLFHASTISPNSAQLEEPVIRQE